MFERTAPLESTIPRAPTRPTPSAPAAAPPGPRFFRSGADPFPPLFQPRSDHGPFVDQLPHLPSRLLHQRGVSRVAQGGERPVHLPPRPVDAAERAVLRQAAPRVERQVLPELLP